MPCLSPRPAFSNSLIFFRSKEFSTRSNANSSFSPEPSESSANSEPKEKTNKTISGDRVSRNRPKLLSRTIGHVDVLRIWAISIFFLACLVVPLIVSIVHCTHTHLPQYVNVQGALTASVRNAIARLR